MNFKEKVLTSALKAKVSEESTPCKVSAEIEENKITVNVKGSLVGVVNLIMEIVKNLAETINVDPQEIFDFMAGFNKYERNKE